MRHKIQTGGAKIVERKAPPAPRELEARLKQVKALIAQIPPNIWRLVDTPRRYDAPKSALIAAIRPEQEKPPGESYWQKVARRASWKREGSLDFRAKSAESRRRVRTSSLEVRDVS